MGVAFLFLDLFPCIIVLEYSSILLLNKMSRWYTQNVPSKSFHISLPIHSEQVSIQRSGNGTKLWVC